jgi:hypothetical protein
MTEESHLIAELAFPGRRHLEWVKLSSEEGRHRAIIVSTVTTAESYTKP